MKRIIIGLLFSLWSTLASAGINCPIPFNLTNGTTADATQVMANYNALIACLARAATAGANNDITSILGLTTPLSASGGGTQWFIGGTSTGAANAQIVSALTPSGFNLTPNTFVVFTAGFTNTGATTWAMNGSIATAVKVHTAAGLSALSGGEIVAGQVTLGFFDGTQYQLLDAAPSTSLVQPCTIINYVGVTVPSGYLVANGSVASRTSFPNLFACITVSGVAATTSNGSGSVVVPNSALFQVGWSVGGNNVTCNSTISSIPDGTHIVINNTAGASGSTTLTIGPYGQGDCSTTFTLPDLQGRLTTMVDTAGLTLSATACPNPASIGSKCGSTTQTILTTNLPNSAPTVASAQVTSAVRNLTTVSGTTDGNELSLSNNANALAGTFSSNITVLMNPLGSSTPFLLQPVGLVNKAIKF